jgi:methyltransferase (TIGR00027 family)
VQPDRPSSTAEMVASWRALETLLPEEARILDDPHARAFLGPARARLVETAERLPARMFQSLYRKIDRGMGGVLSFVVARHRAMDDLIRGLPEPLEQLVLLGSGYDARPRRLHAELTGAKVYEVDHPATARRRAERLGAAFGEGPVAERVPVVVDFERDDLALALRSAGLDPSRRTVWIWEGVTMYLEEPAIRSTLRLISGLSSPGALLCFDVWCPPQSGVGALAFREVPNLAMQLLYSEPLRWGPPRDSLEPLLREEGLALIELTSNAELGQRYGVRRRPWLEASHMNLCVAEVDRILPT